VISFFKTRVKWVERVNTERVEMAEVQREDDEFPRHRDRGDRDIRETWMPTGGLRGIAQRTRDPCRGKVERKKAVRIVVEDAIEPLAPIPGALAGAGSVKFGDPGLNLGDADRSIKTALRSWL
jgi:hypothetical protein